MTIIVTRSKFSPLDWLWRAASSDASTEGQGFYGCVNRVLSALLKPETQTARLELHEGFMSEADGAMWADAPTAEFEFLVEGMEGDRFFEAYINNSDDPREHIVRMCPMINDVVGGQDFWVLVTEES